MSVQKIFKIPAAQQEWVVLYCKALTFFAFQGLIILGLYALRGFSTTPDALPPGLRLDPLHGVIHLVTGLLGAYFGFRRLSAALGFLKVFTVFYLTLAVLGTFTDTHFGMQLELEENMLHWPLSVAAALIAFAPGLLPGRSRAA